MIRLDCGRAAVLAGILGNQQLSEFIYFRFG
jgi:hypothetical protein